LQQKGQFEDSSSNTYVINTMKCKTTHQCAIRVYSLTKNGSILSTFLISSNMTALVRILSYDGVSGISKMVACDRKWIFTTNSPRTLTLKSIRIRPSPVIIPNAKNINISVGISLLSCTQAEIYVISYPLPVTDRHLWFLDHSDTRHYVDQFSRVAWHRKHRHSRKNFVAIIIYTSWGIRYFISTSGYMPPTLIFNNNNNCPTYHFERR